MPARATPLGFVLPVGGAPQRRGADDLPQTESTPPSSLPVWMQAGGVMLSVTLSSTIGYLLFMLNV